MSDDLETQGGGEAVPETVQETQSAPEPVDRRAAIAAAFESRETPSQSVEAPEARQRSRDEAGRYAIENKDGGQSPPAAPPPPEKPARKYPSSWRREVQPLWERVASDPELQVIADEIERRENDFHKGTEPLRVKAQFAEAIERVIAPFQSTIQSLGVTPDVAVQQLLIADHRLRHGAPHEKAQLLMQLAQNYGIDMGNLPQQAQVDPNTAALMSELENVKAQLYHFTNSQQQAQQSYIQQDLQKFAADKPHFDAVREDMAALLQGGRASDLDTAYDMAVWARPDIRSSLLEQQMKDAEKTRKEEAQRAVAAAKSAAVQVRGAPTGAVSNPPLKDRRAQIAAAFDRSRI